jgi:hypothetical protein
MARKPEGKSFPGKAGSKKETSRKVGFFIFFPAIAKGSFLCYINLTS